MSASTLTTRPLMRIGAVLIVLFLAAAAWIARPDRAASVVPAGQRIGTLTFSDISTAAVPLRSFSFEAKATPCDFSGGGGCASRAEFGNPVVTLDTSALSPAELATLASGQHLPKLTVELYRPLTTTKVQDFIFENATFTQLKTSTTGPATAWPGETLGWAYTRVTTHVYDTATGAVVSETCWDLAQSRRC
jgi:hypothetical protein